MGNLTQGTEIAIVGAGIVGLAHALAAARRGCRVTVFERSDRALGASIRNFGMVWPIGQPLGHRRQRALVSRRVWLTMAERGGYVADPVGSLHLAYQPEEWQVLQEFAALAGAEGVTLLTAEQVAIKSPAAVTEGLLGALWSPTEVIVDARQAIARLAALLSQDFGVRFQFGCPVTEIAYPHLRAGGDRWRADHIFVCSGADLETLYPEVYRTSGITKAKLQMLRTVPQPPGWRLGPALCGGLTLTHYAAFAQCPSLAALKQRCQVEFPQAIAWGIHVMACQNGLGELVLGDSHEYGLSFDPFDRQEINDFILQYLGGFARFPDPRIAATWHGIYSKLPGQTEFIAHPEPGVTLVNALSGAGMTLSFGLAEELIGDLTDQPLEGLSLAAQQLN